MTLLQLRYLIKIVECGSFSRAAAALYLRQPTLSRAIGDLEKEMDIRILTRAGRGVQLTEDGRQFLAYARQVVEQADLLEETFLGKRKQRRVFGVSTQHYTFAVEAFIRLVREYGEDTYTFSLRETRTYGILEDVRSGRSEVGILYLSRSNREILLRLIDDFELTFTPEFTARPHVFVSRDNPLARRGAPVKLDELEAYPRLVYDQGTQNSFYLSEELHSTLESPKNIVVTDRASLFNLLTGLNGYTICSGVKSPDTEKSGVVSLPLQSDEIMEIGCVHPIDYPLGKMAQRYLAFLRGTSKETPGVEIIMR